MSDVDLTPSLTRPTAHGIAVRAGGMGLGLAVAMFLARSLAAEDLGAYQGVLSLCIIVGGLAAATAERPASRRIAALGTEDPDNDDPGNDDPEELPREVASAHLIVGLAGLAVVLSLLAISLVPGVPDPARMTLRLAALVSPGLAILSLRQWIALPLQGVAASLGPEQIGLPIVFLGLAALAAHQGGLGPTEALVLYAGVCWLVWLVSSWRSGLLALLGAGLRAVPPPPLLRARLRESRPFVLLTAVGVLPLYATVPLVAALLDLADAGRLAIALQLTGVVAVPLQIVSLAVMPRAARLHRDRDIAGIDALVRTASGISLGLGVGLAALLLLALDTVLDVLGPSFTTTRDLVPVLVLGQLVNAALGPNGPTLQMIGLEREAARVETLATVTRLAAVALAASAGNILGVAFAITATTTLRNVLLSTTLYRRAGILTLPQVPRRRDRAR